MRYVLAVIVLATGVFVSPVHAGPVDTPIPVNPCGAARLKLALVANGVGTDGFPINLFSCLPNIEGCVETLVVCHHTGPTGAAPIDVAVELFDAAGGPIPSGLGSSCALAPGASASFMTGFAILQAPYQGLTLIQSNPQVPLGSLRVLSTSAKPVVCDVTVVNRDSFSSPWAADVTVTKSNKAQRGD
jgi:hypothetical protein